MLNQFRITRAPCFRLLHLSQPFYCYILVIDSLCSFQLDIFSREAFVDFGETATTFELAKKLVEFKEETIFPFMMNLCCHRRTNIWIAVFDLFLTHFDGDIYQVASQFTTELITNGM